MGAGIMPPMSERPDATEASGPACPFVAFEADRDARSTVPDHRHRCFAELRPALRSHAHQDAYCLSAAFPGCPTFLEWARREAATARSTPPPSPPEAHAPPAGSGALRDEAPESAAAPESPAAPQATPQATPQEPPQATPRVEPSPLAPGPGRGPAYPTTPPPVPSSPAGSMGEPGGHPSVPGSAGIPGTPGSGGIPGASGPDAGRMIRNSRRDWAAPPPWVRDEAARTSRGEGSPPKSERPSPEAGLAASAAAWLGAGPEDVAPDEPTDPAGTTRSTTAPSGEPATTPTWDPREEVRGWDEDGSKDRAGRDDPARDDRDARDDRAARDDRDEPTERDDRARAARRQRPPAVGPAWEEPPRREVFPTLQSRVALPGLSPLGLWFVALIGASVVLFFAPQVLVRLAGGVEPTALPSPTAEPTPAPTPAPTPEPSPTPRVYVVKPNDTLSGIAAKFGISSEALLAANPAVTDPDRIKIGDELVVPTAPPSSIPDGAPPTIDDAASSPAP